MIGKKTFRLIWKSLLFSFAGLLFLFALVHLWAERNEKLLTDRFVLMVQEKLGQPFSLDSIDIIFSPWPVVTADNLATEGGTFSCTVKRIVAEPSLVSLMTGTLALDYLALEDPKFAIATGDHDTAESETNPREALDDFFSRFLPVSTTFTVVNGSLSVKSKSNLRVQGIDCTLVAQPNKSVRGDMFVSSLTIAMATETVRVQDFFFEGGIDLEDFFSEHSRGIVKARLTGLPGIRDMLVKTAVRAEKGALHFDHSIRGHIAVGGIPFSCKGPMRVERGWQAVHFAGLAATLGKRDSVKLVGSYNHPDRSLSGTLTVARVSLTEWLGFARGLPPGLQRTLDTVQDGSIVFDLDAQKLVVKSVKAKCAGSFFSGVGGVSDWSRPVVFLDMKAPKVNLIRGIPEAGAVLPAPLNFAHPPLTPETSDSSGSSVGYDIRLGADRVLYGPLVLESAAVQIHPGPVKGRDSPVVIDAQAKLYDGHVQGSCALGGLDTVTYAIKLLVSEVNGAPLGNALPRIPIRKGKWTAQVAITSSGTELDDFLRQLRGSVRVDAKHGELAFGSSKGFSFSSCQLRLDPLKSGQWKQSMLGIDGQWRGTFDFGQARAELQGVGKLWFGETADSSGFALQGIPATFSASLTQSASRTFSCKGSTIVSWLPQQSLFRLAESRFQAGDAAFSGNVDVLTRKELTFLAKGSWDVPNLSGLISQLRGSQISLPDSFSSVRGTAQLQATLQKATFSDLRLTTKLGQVGGSFGLEFGRQIKLLPTLTVETLSFDDFPTSAQNSSEKPPDFRELDALFVQGSVLVRRLKVKKFVLSDVRVPLVLERSVLTCTQARGRLFDGWITANMTLLFHKGYSLHTSIILEKANLARVSESLMEKAAMEGQGYVSGSLRAAFPSFAELPVRLFGSWSFRIADGIYQALNAKRKPQGSSVSFDALQASGTIANGIIESKNIALTSKTLHVTGRGELNLKKQTVDSTLEVDMKGLPRFPLYIEGTLQKTKTSFGAGSFLLNAVAGLFSSMFSLFR
ncbi:MAG: hypothetical protein IJU76_13390 [Desulfovibrionaceae bacterium]|nr:hypothetical protein [Desulfovibrionaceae bacterium]